MGLGLVISVDFFSTSFFGTCDGAVWQHKQLGLWQRKLQGKTLTVVEMPELTQIPQEARIRCLY
jgi:hypothetical protein